MTIKLRDYIITVFNDSAAMTGNEQAFEDALKAYEMEIAENLREAQAPLQVALGFYRMYNGHDDMIEQKLTYSLHQIHDVMKNLGITML